jgi:protein disulfide-isomerase
VDDIETLEAVASSCGMNTDGLREVLTKGELEDEVKMDIHESRQLGVRGVPFFVFDRKYAVSGAQEPSAFSQVLEQSFAEWKKANAGKLEVLEGQQCTPAGKCE